MMPMAFRSKSHARIGVPSLASIRYTMLAAVSGSRCQIRIENQEKRAVPQGSPPCCSSMNDCPEPIGLVWRRPALKRVGQVAASKPWGRRPASSSRATAGPRAAGSSRPVTEATVGLLPTIGTVMADAGHDSRKLARPLLQHEGWKLNITRRG